MDTSKIIEAAKKLDKTPKVGDLVNCVLCNAPHIREPGPVNIENPICPICKKRLDNPPSGPTDTVDFHVRGF